MLTRNWVSNYAGCPALGASLSRGIRIRRCARRRFAAARDRGATRGEISREIHPADKSAPTGFRPATLGPQVLPGVKSNRRHYELCACRNCAHRLRAGDVWVAGSRQYRSFEERLDIQEDPSGTTTDRNVGSCRRNGFRRVHRKSPCHTDKRLAMIRSRASDGLLPDVTIEKGVLKIGGIEKSTPPEAEALAVRLYACGHASGLPICWLKSPDGRSSRILHPSTHR